MIQQVYILLFALFISIFAFVFAYWRGFFKIERPWSRKGSFFATLGAFTIYFSFQLIVEPLAMLGLLKIFGRDSVLMIVSLIKFIGMFLVAISLLFYAIAWQKAGLFPLGKGNFQDGFLGISVWALAFPLIISLGQFVNIGVQFFYPEYTELQQVAVKYLQSLLDYPFLFFLNGFGIVFFVPITEELLFRGFFQTWLLACDIKSIFAIGISSLLFAFMHYAPEQGLANLELLSSLFILGLLLGFLYERQRTIIAPIALHSFFNFMSFLLILFTS